MKNYKIALLSILAANESVVLTVGPSECGSKLTTLTVGTDTAGSLGFVPFEQKSGGTITGFDVAVAVEVAHRLGYETTTFRQIPFSRFSNLSVPSTFPLLNEANTPNSQIDLAIAALSIVARTNSTSPASVINFPNIGSAKYSDDTLGIVMRADADSKFTNPATVLDELSEASCSSNAIFVSRESQIIFAYGFEEKNFLTLSEVVAGYISFPGEPASPSFILTDSATAEALGKLAATDSSLFGFPVQVLTNVIDQKNAVPSQGLGIAVGGVNESGTSCIQLLANVSQALKDMVADGTMALLRAQFNVASTDDEIGTITPTQTTPVTPTIPSNVIHNFYFTKYGTPTVIIGPDVPVIG